MPKPLLINISEAAEYLRLSPTALYNQRHRGQAPGALFIKVGRKLVARQADLDSWLDARVEAQLRDNAAK